MHIKEENMRNFKRGVAFAMAAVMTVSMTGVISADANEESSTISSWKEEAVITPTTPCCFPPSQWQFFLL